MRSTVSLCLSDPQGGDELGVFCTVSFAGGATHAAPVRIWEETSSVFDDDNSTLETQPHTRPEGLFTKA